MGLSNTEITDIVLAWRQAKAITVNDEVVTQFEVVDDFSAAISLTEESEFTTLVLAAILVDNKGREQHVGIYAEQLRQARQVGNNRLEVPDKFDGPAWVIGW